MTETPLGTETTPLVGARGSVFAALWWAARTAASVFTLPYYGRGDFDEKFIRANDSPRTRLRSKRRARKRTTESRS